MQTILILDSDRGANDALAELLCVSGRHVILCGDVESAELVVNRTPAPDFVITTVRLSSHFRYERLDFIEYIKRCAPSSHVVVLTGSVIQDLQEEALARGADVVLGKPLCLASLRDILTGGEAAAERGCVIRTPLLDDILRSGLLVPKYQPIVDLTTEVIRGFESLARYQGELFSDPVMLFEYAARKGRLVELELACIRASLHCGRGLSGIAKLFLNIHPSVIANERLCESLTEAAAIEGVAPQQVVLEITEQASLGKSSMVQRRCDTLRGRGFAFALDDIGMAYSHLARIDDIQPAYLKISPEFGTNFERNATRKKIVKHALSLARDFGCELILEGIESIQTKDAADDLGVPLGQGFLFQRPASASRFLP
jgi:EAL domain-containing protein (putative c-di-GMP-specific phosphodiesterase class I)/ActR/RegA family two-component response regulator